MPSFADSAVIFVLALLLLGPKKLPLLARELGKWIGEFRRASNEFKMQMEEELRLSEQAERQKQIAAMEAAAPPRAPIPEPEHPHQPSYREAAPNSIDIYAAAEPAEPIVPAAATENSIAGPAATEAPLPIASNGDLHLMPPATGLPTPRPRSLNSASDQSSEPAAGVSASDPLGLSSIPTVPPSESATHA